LIFSHNVFQKQLYKYPQDILVVIVVVVLFLLLGVGDNGSADINGL